ncbi:hypothetical protein PROFUN_15968, partial [Planoprotostelium fungivorum]
DNLSNSPDLVADFKARTACVTTSKRNLAHTPSKSSLLVREASVLNIIVVSLPTMREQDCLHMLAPAATQLSLILGDVNARFDSSIGNTSSGPREQMDTIEMAGDFTTFT